MENGLIMCFMNSRPWNVPLPVFCWLLDTGKLQAGFFYKLILIESWQPYSYSLWRLSWRIKLYLVFVTELIYCNNPKANGENPIGFFCQGIQGDAKFIVGLQKSSFQHRITTENNELSQFVKTNEKRVYSNGLSMKVIVQADQKFLKTKKCLITLQRRWINYGYNLI